MEMSEQLDIDIMDNKVSKEGLESVKSKERFEHRNVNIGMVPVQKQSSRLNMDTRNGGGQGKGSQKEAKRCARSMRKLRGSVHTIQALTLLSINDFFTVLRLAVTTFLIFF